MMYTRVTTGILQGYNWNSSRIGRRQLEALVRLSPRRHLPCRASLGAGAGLGAAPAYFGDDGGALTGRRHGPSKWHERLIGGERAGDRRTHKNALVGRAQPNESRLSCAAPEKMKSFPNLSAASASSAG